MKKNLLMIILFFLIIIGLPVATIIIPDKKFSENENRFLAELPTPDIKRIQDESFMKGVEAYVSDHFVGRENWIRSKNSLDLLMGKTEIAGVITQDNQMIEAWKQYDKASVEKNLVNINMFAKKHPELNVSFILSPTVQGVSMDKLPKYAGLINQEEFIKECYSKLDELDTINVFDTLKENSDKYIFYRTDHHWTSLGAYLAYVQYCNYAGITPYKSTDFDVEEVSDSFRGTLFSKTLNSEVSPDEINYYILKDNEPDVTVQVVGKNREHDELYFREYLDKKDKYSSFLGTNEAIVNIKSNVNSNGKSLLIIKDSYAHALVPFLSKHYENITMVDMRYLNPRSIEDIDLNEYSDVLFMYNVITFSGEKAFFMLDKLENKQ